MTAGSRAFSLAAAAVCLGLAAMMGPTGLAWVVLPAAAALGWFAHDARDRVSEPAPPRWFAVGAVSAAAGLVALLWGAAGAGFLAMLGGAWAALTATREALAAAPAGAAGPPPPGLASHAAVAADEGLLAGWQLIARASPSRVPLDAIDDVRSAVERYRASGLAADPSRAHPLPPALEKAHLARRHLPVLGEVEELSFESEYEPFDPEVRERYLDLAPNRVAQATLLRHPDRPRPTLLCVHGLAGGIPAWDARLFATRRLHALGLDIVQVMLPFHGRRTVARIPGQGFLDGHPLVTNAAFGQAIWELRRIAGWVRAQGAPAVGVLGVSLGGYTAALFSSVERGVASSIAMIPAVRLASLVRRETRPAVRRALDAVGFGDALLEEVYTPHAVLGHRPRVAPEARLIVAGQADRVCPPSHAEALWEHWDRPAIHWFPGSHLVRHGGTAMRGRIDAHLRETLVSAADPLPLTRFRQ